MHIIIYRVTLNKLYHNRLGTMMKKLMFLLFLVASSIAPSSVSNLCIIYTYKDVPEWCAHDETVFQSMIICAAWAAKYTPYTFEQLHNNGKTAFAAYNEDCIFALRYDKELNECDVEFNVDDDSFNFSNFKTILDSYFLYT